MSGYKSNITRQLMNMNEGRKHPILVFAIVCKMSQLWHGIINNLYIDIISREESECLRTKAQPEVVLYCADVLQQFTSFCKIINALVNLNPPKTACQHNLVDISYISAQMN